MLDTLADPNSVIYTSDTFPRSVITREALVNEAIAAIKQGTEDPGTSTTMIIDDKNNTPNISPLNTQISPGGGGSYK